MNAYAIVRLQLDHGYRPRLLFFSWLPPAAALAATFVHGGAYETKGAACRLPRRWSLDRPGLFVEAALVEVRGLLKRSGGALPSSPRRRDHGLIFPLTR